MDISIIGGGSIGLLIASYLGKKHKVTVFTRTKMQAEELNKKGVVLKKDLIGEKTPIRAKQFEHWQAENSQLTIIAVKQGHIPEITRKIKDKKGSYFFIQNGMGHIKWITEMKAESIFIGSVEHGANKLNLHTVQHNGFGVIKAANFKGSNEVLDSLAESLGDTFPIVIVDDFEEMLLKKLIVNAVINPLTAVLNVTNGKLVENQHFYQLLQALFNEVTEILETPNEDKEFRNLIEICKNTANNRSSMLKDLDEHKLTEIDGILGYLLEIATEKNKSAPLITHYYYAIKGKEQEREGR